MRKLNILVGVLIFACSISVYAGQNLINNPDFETGKGALPDGWEPWQWLKDPQVTVITWESKGAQSGAKCISIENKQPNDARLKQTVAVQENKKYRLACWLKTENVGPDKTGAGITILYHPESSTTVKGTTQGWQLAEMYAQTGKGITSIDVTVALGGHGGENSGKAYFDNITVEEVDQIPAGAVVSNLTPPGEKSTDAKAVTAAQPKSVPMVLLLVVIAVAVVAGAVLLNILGKKKKAQAK